jgi:dTDP-4-dehydrorhamnose reductase
MKIFLTGGSGLLGKELIKSLKQEHDVCYPSSTECDIKDKEKVNSYFERNKFDLCIHCAAFISIAGCEKEIEKAIETNVVGTCNITQACIKSNTKLVYISTTHVFDGSQGHYTITDAINPIGKYAKSKAAGELVARMYENSLVIRTEFYGKEFPYEAAFTDRWASKDYIDIIAPKILMACLSAKKGIKHVGSKRRSLYEIAIQRKPEVKPIMTTEVKLNVPVLVDTSIKMDEENGRKTRKNS